MWDSMTKFDKYTAVLGHIQAIERTPPRIKDFNDTRPAWMPTFCGMDQTWFTRWNEWLGIAGRWNELEEPALCECGNVISTGRIIVIGCGGDRHKRDTQPATTPVLALCADWARLFDETEGLMALFHGECP